MLRRKLGRLFTICLALLVAIFVTSSCSKYEKLLKSSDYDEKYKAALSYYEKGKYKKAAQLFESVEPIVRGTPRDDTTRFYKANSYFLDKDPFTAEYFFEDFKNVFPRSPFAEKAFFLHGVCLYESSYRPELDQGPTEKALVAFNEFFYSFPHSSNKAEAQKMVDELVARLVKKSYLNAKFYIDVEDYKAAVVALKVALKDYPETDYREDMLFLILKSSYLYAHNSIQEKQRDRYQASIDEYYNLISEYPASKHLKEAQSMYKVATKAVAVMDKKSDAAEDVRNIEGQ